MIEIPPLHWVDYAIVAAYFAASLAIGLAMTRRAGTSSESYFLGGRNLPWWLAGVSLAATSLAADTPLVVTELVRGRGLERLWWLFASTLTLIVGIFLFSRLWRRLGAMTDAEFCELRYDGPAAAVLRGVRAFMSGVVGNLLVMAWVTLGMASVLTVMSPLDKNTALAVTMGTAVLYTTLGGFLGTVLTDFMQFIVSVLAMVVLAVVAVQGFGGHEAVLAAVRAAPGYGEQTLSLLPDFTGSKLDLACFVIIVTLWWGDAGGYVMQRLSASRNERDAAKAMVFFAVWQSIRPWMWVVVALVSIGLFPVLRAPFSDTQAYPLVMNTYLGPGARGLLLAAFAAAFMSTMTTQLNWGASYLMRDLYERFFRPKASPREKLLVARVATVALAVAGMALAPLLSSITQAWEFFAFLTAGSGLFAVLRWFYWRINAWTELSALILGLACAGANLLLPVLAPEWSVGGTRWLELRFEFKLLLFTLLVVPTSLIVTWCTAPVAEAKLKAFYRKVRPGGWWPGWNDGDTTLPEPALSPRALRGVGASLCLCLGSTLCLGYLVVRQPWLSLGGLLLALVGAFGTYRWFQKTFSQDSR